MKKNRLVIGLVVAFSVFISTGVLAGIETQNFNTSPSDWEARSVTDGGYSDVTGWSNTSNAGGAVGEGHAKFQRLYSGSDGLNENVAWYADRSLGEALNVSTQVLSATGQFKITDNASYPDLGAGMWLGWFRPGGGCRMGIMINNYNDGPGLAWYAGIYNNYGGLVAQQYMGSVSAGLTYNFLLEYDNNEGAYGKGRLVARLTPEGNSMEQSVIHMTDYLSNYEFSAFGLARPNPGAYAPWNYKAIDMYLDNVSYTSNAAPAVPEPGSLLALGSGLIGFAGLGIRRKK